MATRATARIFAKLNKFCLRFIDVTFVSLAMVFASKNTVPIPIRETFLTRTHSIELPRISVRKFGIAHIGFGHTIFIVAT